MWTEAEDLINGDNLITIAPGSDKTAKMVKSYSSGGYRGVCSSSDEPHFFPSDQLQFTFHF